MLSYIKKADIYDLVIKLLSLYLCFSKVIALHYWENDCIFPVIRNKHEK